MGLLIFERWLVEICETSDAFASTMGSMGENGTNKGREALFFFVTRFVSIDLRLVEMLQTWTCHKVLMMFQCPGDTWDIGWRLKMFEAILFMAMHFVAKVYRRFFEEHRNGSKKNIE